MTRYDKMDPPAAPSFRLLLAYSLWLHVGLIGAITLAVGLLGLFDGETERALGLIFFGGMLTAASWRRGLTVLERTRHAPAVLTGAPDDPSLRATSVSTERGAAAMLSAIPLASNRRGR